MPKNPTNRVSVRAAFPDDAETILGFIRALAEYERLGHEVERASLERLRLHLDVGCAACDARVAELDGEPVGFALFFETYSTFETAVCLHLEDLFVLESARGHGVGRALLAAVAAIAIERRCPRLQWNVLDWNEPAIRFYEALGAVVMPEWRTCRVAGEMALARLIES